MYHRMWLHLETWSLQLSLERWACRGGGWVLNLVTELLEGGETRHLETQARGLSQTGKIEVGMSLQRTNDRGRPGSSFQGLATGKEFYLASQRDAGTPCLKPPFCEIWHGRPVLHSLVFWFQPEWALTDRLGLGEQPWHRKSKSLPAT